MAKPSDYPGFNALLKEWNKKLSQSGFNDIESPRSQELKKSGTERRYERLDSTVRNARSEYFVRVAQATAETQFHDDVERRILVLYSQGVSQVAIQADLGIQGHRCKIYNPLYKWLRAWGLKK